MIHDLVNLKAMQNLSQHLEGSESIERIPIKEQIDSLSKIQIGDLLQGELIVEGEQSWLKLEEGLKLLVNLPLNELFNKKLDFYVVGKENGRLLLEYVPDKANQNGAVGIVDQALQELDLKDTPEMRQMIEKFVGKQLPLIKEQLMRFVHFTKSYTVPTEVLTNLVSQNQVPKQEEIEILTTLKEEGIKTLLPAWDTFVQELTSYQSRDLAKNLLSLLNPQQVEQSLQKVNLLQYEEEVGKSLSHLVNNESSLTDIQIEKWQDELFKQLDQMLNSASHSQLNELNKDFIKDYLVLHLDRMSHGEKNEIEKIIELSTRLKQVVKSAKEVKLENGAEVHLKVLEKNIEVLDKYKMQGQYYCFPLQLKEQQITGEFYFFKPKKNKLQQESGLYIVLALNMPALHKIEVHLMEKSNEMTLKIKVENEGIKKQLQEHESVLLERMDEGVILLKKIEIELLNEKQPKLELLYNELHGLDLKI